MIPTETLRAAEAHLADSDPVMAGLIARYGPSTLGRKRREAFHVICASIIAQQLSAKAADTIQKRVAALIGAPMDGFEHHHFEAATQETLRACGLSNAKAKWLLELAARQRDGRFDGAALARLDDATLTAELDALPGIGLWTAEMMLIFAFDRLDVFSLGDVGLRNAVNALYAPKGRDGKPKKLDDKKTLKIAAKWSPYRSVACWYLWRGIDGDIGTWT
jgi:DNA-3-methyladenine glycosylase II